MLRLQPGQRRLRWCQHAGPVTSGPHAGSFTNGVAADPLVPFPWYGPRDRGTATAKGRTDHVGHPPPHTRPWPLQRQQTINRCPACI